MPAVHPPRAGLVCREHVAAIIIRVVAERAVLASRLHLVLRVRHWLRQGGTLLGYSALVAMARAVPEVSEERFADAITRIGIVWAARELAASSPPTASYPIDP
jgi:hypothetical protein